MSEHIATCPVLAQWSSLPLAFVSRSVGVVSGTPSSSPALRRTVGRATRGFPECRANSPLRDGSTPRVGPGRAESTSRPHSAHTHCALVSPTQDNPVQALRRPRSPQVQQRQVYPEEATDSISSGTNVTSPSRRQSESRSRSESHRQPQSTPIKWLSEKVRESPPVSIHAESSSDGSPETSSAERMVENIARNSH